MQAAARGWAFCILPPGPEPSRVTPRSGARGLGGQPWPFTPVESLQIWCLSPRRGRCLYLFSDVTQDAHRVFEKRLSISC